MKSGNSNSSNSIGSDDINGTDSILMDDIRHVAEQVDAFILSNLKGEPLKLYEASLHYIRSGGKRLRPYIVVRCSELLNGSIHKALPIAGAVEMIHNFTLVHDDIMDNDELRHGVPTVHREYGLAYGVLAGDLLLIEAFNTVVKHGKSVGLSPESVSRIMGVLADACKELSEGQALDMELAARKDLPSEAEYLNMINKKTASLFYSSCIAGALTITTDGYILDRIGRFGRGIGMAFQLIDDLIGVMGDSSVTKKPVGNDIREGKKTMPLLLGLKRCRDDERARMLSILGADVRYEDIAYTIDILTKLGIEREVRGMAEHHISSAVKNLEEIDGRSDVKEMLVSLARFIVRRDV